MKRDVVRDFLNLPGIVGIALVDGRSRPFFFGIDQTLNFQQKEALAQGIQQVIETTPSNFEFFEFQFSGHQVYIYKLEHGIILLVLTNEQLVYSSYSPLVSQLKRDLQDDLSNAIANFRLVAGNVTLSSQSYWRRQSETSTSTLSTGLSASSEDTSKTSPGSKTTPSSEMPASASSETSNRERNGRDWGVSPPSSSSGGSNQRRVNQNPTLPASQQPQKFQSSEAQPSVPAKPATTPQPSDLPRSPSKSSAAANAKGATNANAAHAAQAPANLEKTARAPDTQPTKASTESPSGTTTNRPRNNRSQTSSTQPPTSHSPVSSQFSYSPVSSENSTPAPQKPADQDRPVAKSGNTDEAQGTSDRPVTLKEILEALNQLSRLTTRYLGTTIVANYWKSSRPPVEWLANFEVDRSGTISFAGPMTPGKSMVLSSAQHQLLRDWVAAFVQRCSRVIRDFSKIIRKMELNPRQRSLLLPSDSP